MERSLRRRTSRQAAASARWVAPRGLDGVLAARSGEAAPGLGLGKALAHEGGDHRLALRLREHAQRIPTSTATKPWSSAARTERAAQRASLRKLVRREERQKVRERWFASDTGVRTFSQNTFPRL